MISGGFVLGYHGCDNEVGERLLAGDKFVPSKNDYDWLGLGIYFWENNPKRAYDWASFMAGQPKLRERVKKPFAVGAVINLGNCLDLTESSSLQAVRAAYDEYVSASKLASMIKGEELILPQNLKSHKGDEDLTKRFLDCAVINYLHVLRKAKLLPAFDTVRGAFQEGDELYPGAMIRQKTHIQIAVVNSACIQGIFRIKPELLAEK